MAPLPPMNPAQDSDTALDATTQYALRKVAEALESGPWSTEVAALRERLLRIHAEQPTLVVAGEVGRGKSTLVNALLARPGLSPTGRGETTAVALSFVPPTAEAPDGSARLIFDTGDRPELRAIDPGELRDWITVDGARLRAAGDQPPRGAEISVSGPWLPGVTIVDTPGTGGLSPAHARAALLAAAEAGVLLVVTDAGGRLSEPALEFMDQCVASIATVIVAVNKIDATRTWDAVVAENQEILAERFAGAEIAVVPVSAAWAVAALDDQAPEVGERYAAMSRLPDLAATLGGAFAAFGDRAVVNALRGLDDLLGRASRDVELRRAAMDDPATGAEELAGLQARAAELKSFRWDVGDDVADLRIEVGDQIIDEFRVLRRRWEERLQSSLLGFKAGRRAQLFNEFKDEMTVLYYDISQRIYRTATTVAERLYREAGLEIPATLGELIVSRASTPRATAQNWHLPDQRDLRTHRSSILMHGFRTGVLGGVVGSRFGGGLMSLPAALGGALIGAIGGALLGNRLANPQQLERDVRLALDDSERELQRQLRDATEQLRRGIAEEFKDAKEREIARVQELVVALRGERERSQAERAAVRAVVEEEMAKLSAARTVVGREVKRLSAHPATP